MESTQSIGHMLHHVAALLAKQTDQTLLERLGIGFSQFKILVVLLERTNLQQKEIANLLGQTEASISRQMKLLQSQGLVTVQINPANRREHVSALTSRGIRFTDEALKITQAQYAPLFDTMPEKDQVRLRRILQNLSTQLS